MNFQGNWVDLIILIVLFYIISDSLRSGFWVIIADFFSFFLSLLLALAFFSYATEIMESVFSLPHSIANALGFFLVAGLSEALIGFILVQLINKIPYKYWKEPWNRIAGIVPAAGQGLILIAFVLTLIVGLPISPSIKKDVSASKIGGFLIKETSGIEAKLNEIFGGLVEDSLLYLTIKPGSTDSIPIEAESQSLVVDHASESEMITLVNSERRKRGIQELGLRPELVPVARDHATDMWRRNYFGHVSPEGDDVGDRLEKANVSYALAGENLALAPTLQTAHTGLMNSEGHRRNILDPEFKKIGIGVIDNAYYGKIFVQIFSD